VALQKSFLDAFLRGIDDRNWLKGPNAPNGVPAINLTLRKGDPGFNTFEAEKMFPRRTEVEWPIARTQYTKYYLGADELIKPQQRAEKRKFEYKGLVGEPLHFWTEAFTEETEITGHIVANLVFSIDMDDDFKVPKDMDIFLTIRHFNPEGKEIIYTGTWLTHESKNQILITYDQVQLAILPPWSKAGFGLRSGQEMELILWINIISHIDLSQEKRSNIRTRDGPSRLWSNSGRPTSSFRQEINSFLR